MNINAYFSVCRSSNQNKRRKNMSASGVEIDDFVLVHSNISGRVVDKFLSSTGEEIFDIKTLKGRVAACERHIVINYGARECE